MNILIEKFFCGKYPLWKSYWLVGELLNALVIFIIFNVEILFFNNNFIANTLPFVNFNNFNFLNKIIVILWTAFITIGIWRSAENFKGSFFWIVCTLIFLSYRVFSLRIIFF